MNNFLTQETPGKVMTLLGASLVSMFFLFAVSVSNVGFGVNAEKPFPDPFAAPKVMAVLDVASNQYSAFLTANFINPISQQYALLGDNVMFVAQTDSSQIAQSLGLDKLMAYQDRPQVAGAFIMAGQPVSQVPVKMSAFQKLISYFTQ